MQGRKEKEDTLHLHLILNHHLQNQILIQAHLIVMEGIRRRGGRRKKINTIVGEN
jgi:hypothetical protein